MDRVARKHPRKITFISARAVLATKECVICDMSETGAKLWFTGKMPNVKEFDLHIPSSNTIVRAVCRWRSEPYMGVELFEFGETGEADTPIVTVTAD